MEALKLLVSPHESFSNEEREQWLQSRRKGIGASDSASILGESNWGTPLSVWQSKVEPLESSEMTGYQKWGLLLEEPIANEFEKETGRQIDYENDLQHLYKSSEKPFMLCTPDAFQVKDGKTGLLQIKTTNQYKKKDWNDGVPLQYQIQVQHEMYVTETEFCSVAVLIGGNEFLWCDIERNDKFIAAMLPKMEVFWGLVESKTMPVVSGSDVDAKILAALYPNDSGETVELSTEMIHVASYLQMAKKQIKQIKDEIQEAENTLKAAIGDATYGSLPDGRKYSWKHQSRKGYTVEPTEFRTLRKVGK